MVKKALILMVTLISLNSNAVEPIFPIEDTDSRQAMLALRTVAKGFYKGSPLEEQTRRTLKKYKAEYVSKYYEPHYVVGLMVAQSLIEGRIKLQYRWEF